jgi:preprotein translocase subunit SecB
MQEYKSLDSSINSSFKFVNYKIDEFTFSTTKKVNVLADVIVLSSDNVNLSIGINKTSFFKNEGFYVSGLSAKIDLIKEKEHIATLNIGLSGLFTVDNSSELSQDIIDSIAKLQFPTIMFPYLRGAVTSFLANAGFGSFIFPLINVAAIAENNSDLEYIEIIE